MLYDFEKQIAEQKEKQEEIASLILGLENIRNLCCALNLVAEEKTEGTNIIGINLLHNKDVIAEINLTSFNKLGVFHVTFPSEKLERIISPIMLMKILKSSLAV